MKEQFALNKPMLYSPRKPLSFSYLNPLRILFVNENRQTNGRKAKKQLKKKGVIMK